MKLIIAEKPDIAKAISKVINASPSWKNGYIEQGDYCITWCYGHLLELMAPEDYGKEFARENTPNSALPIFFDNWGMKVADSGTSLLKNGKKPPSKKEQVDTIGKLLKKTNLVIVAGDIDDEGQLLVEELLDWHKYTGSIKRLDTGVLNEVSLKKAMSNLMDNDEWHLRAVSANARRVADFVLGINGSRFFSNLYGANLSVGRVQTATLGLVVNRDEQIEGHSKLKYFLLDMDVNAKGETQPHTARFIPAKENTNLVDGKVLDKKYLEGVVKTVSGKSHTAIVTKEQVSESAPLPFSISALKSYCAEKYGLDPADVLKITQSLRMNYGGLITYNRSECRYLPENMHAEAPAIMACVQANLGAAWKFPRLNPVVKSRAFNDKNTSVHHAIIPTAQKADITKLTDDEQKVYKAICGYYMMQFLPQCKKERTRLVVDIAAGDAFVATSIEILDAGFKAVTKEKEKEESSPLSNLLAGTYPCTLDNPNISEKETKPPKRYTDASLEEDMKSVAKYVTDPEIKKLLLLKDQGNKEEHGSIGTAATRSAIIATLKKRGFLESSGKGIISTSLGREFYRILPDEIQKPDLTAKWWAIQQEIVEESATSQAMYTDVLDVFARIAARQYPDVKLSSRSGENGKPSVGTCPRCGKPIIEGKKGFGCSGYKDGCSFTIWKESKYGAQKILAGSKKKLTTAMVKKILKDGKVLVKGLVSEKTGKTYDAYIVMQDTGKGVFLNFDFTDVPKTKKRK